MLIICEEDSYEIIQNLLIGADIIIIPDESELAFRLLNSKIIKPTQYCMGYSEFFDLSRMNSYYYLSGNIVFYIGDDQELAERVLNISHDKEYNRVYVVNSDFYIAKRNKNISELVNGACKYDYIIKKELI